MTAYNPPSSIYFNGIEFNPSIIEQGDTISGGNATLDGNNTWTGTNNFNGSITMTTQAANNNSTLGATTAYVDNAISGVGGVSLTANNTFTGLNTFSGGINVDTINGTTGTGITIDTASLGTTFEGQVFANNNLYTNEIDGNYLTTPATLYIGQNYAASILIGTDVIPVTIGYGTARPNIANIETVNMIAESIDLITTGYINSPNIYNSSGTLLVGNATTSVDLLGIVTAPTQTAGNNTTRVATTAFVTGAITTLKAAANTWSGANSFTTGSINVTTQTAGNSTTLAASTAFVTTASNAIRSGLLTGTNTWSGSNAFNTASLTVATQLTSDNSSFAASTAFVQSVAATISGVSLSGTNTWTGPNSFTNSISVLTLGTGTNTTGAASTAFVKNSLDALKTAVNTWTNTNSFSSGVITVPARPANDSTTNAASTAFVTSAISALSSIYQTASQVATAISSALTSFLGTANTWTADQDLSLVNVLVKTQLQSVSNTTAASTAYTTLAVTNGNSTSYAYIMATPNTFTANQKFTTIQFSSGTLNQAFYIQHVNTYSFGAVAANTAVTQTFSYATLGMTNYTTFITAQICNSSSSAQGNRVLFSIQAQSASSFTIVGFNVTATNTSASAFSLVVYGR